jgi:hypothetical protein
MLKVMLAVVATLSGGATLGVAVHTQSHRGAVTTPMPLLDTGGVSVKREVLSAIGAMVMPTVAASNEVTLAEMTIRGDADHKPSALPAAAFVPAFVPMTRPCSDWWELGPNASVRMLCR